MTDDGTGHSLLNWYCVGDSKERHLQLFTHCLSVCAKLNSLWNHMSPFRGRGIHSACLLRAVLSQRITLSDVTNQKHNNVRGAGRPAVSRDPCLRLKRQSHNYSRGDGCRGGDHGSSRSPPTACTIWSQLVATEYTHHSSDSQLAVRVNSSSRDRCLWNFTAAEESERVKMLE